LTNTAPRFGRGHRRKIEKPKKRRGMRGIGSDVAKREGEEGVASDKSTSPYQTTFNISGIGYRQGKSRVGVVGE